MYYEIKNFKSPSTAQLTVRLQNSKMAENSSSGMKSFSDSEISLLDPAEHTEGGGRTRNHSEKNFAFLKPHQLKFPRNRNENNSNIISDINIQSLEEVKSALRSLSVPSKQGLKNIDESKVSIKDSSSCIQDQEDTDEKLKSPSRLENILPDRQNVKDDDCNTKETSDGELERQEITPGELISHQDSFEVKQNDTQNSETRNVNTEISSPYQVLERVNPSVQPSENDLLGEPRCLAIKKYAADEDEEFDLDLVMTADIEDDDELLMDKPPEIIQKKKNLPPDPNDMFLDDDPDDVTEVKNIQYVNLESPSKIGMAWDCSKLEKEEGELSPDMYRTHYDLGNSKNTISKKTRATESNLEFLNKVNRCFRQLEREFSNMHVASESKRTVEHLRDLLSVVERMKRKLTVLISSTSSRRNTSKNKDSRNSKDHKSDESSGKSVSEDNSKKINNPDYKDFDDIQTKQLNKYLEERRKIYYEKKAENYLSQNVLAPQPKLGEIISKKEYLRRTHSGSKIEKQRIKSLFKRQMNLITKQIIQQNDQDKHHTPKKILGAKSASNRSSLENLKSLDDMECFLDLLKEKKGQKITPEDIIRDIHKKKLLKFTTKKRSPVAKTRALPVLLGAAKEQEVEKIIPKEIPDSSINLVQPDVPEVIDQIEKQTDAPEKIQQYNEKATKDAVRNHTDHESDKIRDDHAKKGNFSHSLNVKQSSKSNLSKLEKSKEQKVGKNVTKIGEIDNESKNLSLNRIEFCVGERVTSSKEVIDSPLLKRNSKETKSSEFLFHSKASDFEKDSWEIFPESSKKRISKKSLGPKSSESDRDSKRDQILKKRKRNESKDDSRRKLSSSDLKRDSVSERKSRTRYRSDFGDVIDNRREKLPEELLTKQLFIVGDKNLEILDNYFRVKVKDNQIYLQKVGKSRKSRLSRSKERRSSQIKEQQEEESYKRNRSRKERNDPPTDCEDAGATLKEMEEFLQQLRSKKDSSVKQNDTPLQNQQIREMKFMARIQAKRKAKLMACVSTTPNISEKEAKFLKDLENRSKNPGDSPETESKKQKLMEKIRAETDFIVLSQKQAAALEDDPLSDVKSFLSMIKEAESANDENSKQFYVSFSMKRSDVKQLENITTGEASSLSEESQRLLNSVRAKMRAKKAPPTMENEEPQTVV